MEISKEISLDEREQSMIIQMMNDKAYWETGLTPRSTTELIHWAIQDYYDSYLGNKK